MERTEEHMKQVKRLSIFVKGIPAPQGSMTPIRTKSGVTFMKHASKGLPAWRNQVIAELEAWWARINNQERDWIPEDRAYHLDVDFYLPRPKSHTKKQKLDHYRWQRPDLDKLVRAIGDALEIAGILKDDARIASISAVKVYAPADMNTGAAIVLRPIGRKNGE